MKVMSKEESEAHYSQVLQGGLVGGTTGLVVGIAGVMGASRRWPAFRALTLPFRTFLAASPGTFGAIIVADRYSQAFQKVQDPRNFYVDTAQRAAEQARLRESSTQRFVEWCRTNRYTIVGVSWIASMVIAMAIVSRNRFLTTSQKLVQARVYAQGLTLAVLVSTAAFETHDARTGKGRWETVTVLDPNDPEHKHLIEKRVHHEGYEGEDLWMDMVAAEERRLDLQNKARAAREKRESETKKDTTTSN